ncbi:DUF4350 domain-containing protein [Novosphingobium colocasiae]|uniref:DUF4350 domain-containing protein n=1 Tax=Novosphingobium colocasiae TaxID=1256513 RepID=A0A918P8C5_9SPHN|nr:DUF4350 domain-containing protein [Novosphingobium colocasiae]GGY91199.1 hypothetical protein GCM10011614_02340 [Novosphingobium colocasiae]
MSERPGQPVTVGADPFSRRAVLALVVLGSALFVALLYMIGSGTGQGSANDGGGHAGSRGLTGYAAMADYLRGRGFAVRLVRNEGALRAPGLLVLTPGAYVDGKKLAKIVDARRGIGPTMVVTPKWLEQPALPGQSARAGWVRIVGTVAPQWRGFLDELSVSVDQQDKSERGLPRWHAQGLSGKLPDGRALMSGAGTGLVRLVSGTGGRHTLAGFMDDGGEYPELEAMALDRVLHSGEEDWRYPVIVVFEPDLIDNYGLARFENARLAEALVRASGVKPGDQVLFDLTFNGLGQSDNLLTLAFRPPFLAATLCFLLAALVLGWRALLRFGPPLRGGRVIAFGKRALIANAAGLVRRSGRLHLMSRPYADAARERLVRALALPRHLAPEQADAAIDSALHARDRAAEPFSAVAARLRAARNSHDLVHAARELAALERKLTR